MIPVPAQLRQARDLLAANAGVIDLQHLDLGFLGEAVFIDPDDGLSPAVDPRLGAGGGLLDTGLGHTGLDRFGHAAQFLNLADMVPGAGRQLLGQTLDIIAAAPGVDDLGGAALLLQDQLRVAGDAGREVGRQRQRLVQSVGVQRLGMALCRGHRLNASAGDVVEHILGGQRPARGLTMGAQAE